MSGNDRNFLASQVLYSLVIAHTAGKAQPIAEPTKLVEVLMPVAYEKADEMIAMDRKHQEELYNATH